MARAPANGTGNAQRESYYRAAGSFSRSRGGNHACETVRRSAGRRSGCDGGGAPAQDRWRVDFENGAAIAGYNDVRIPGDTGTMFSLTDDLDSDTAYFWRVRADVRLAPKHVLSALVAPLTIHASGTFDQPVSFAGATFAPASRPRASTSSIRIA